MLLKTIKVSSWLNFSGTFFRNNVSLTIRENEVERELQMETEGTLKKFWFCSNESAQKYPNFMVCIHHVFERKI